MLLMALVAVAAMSVAPLAASAASTSTTVGAVVSGEEVCAISTVQNLIFQPYDPANVNGPGGVDDTTTGAISVFCTNQSHYKLSPISGSSKLVAANAPSLNYNWNLASGGGPFTSAGVPMTYVINGILLKGQPAQNLAYADAGFAITVALTSSV